MYKKTALLLTLLVINSMCIFADRGDSYSYTISYKIASDSLDMRSVVDDLYDFLSTFYTVKKEYSVSLTEKYDWKKFNRYKNDFGIRKQDMYMMIKANIEQRQPYLFYKEKNDDYYVYLVFIRYGYFDDRIDEYIIFGEDVDKKVRKYAEEHNWKIRVTR